MTEHITSRKNPLIAHIRALRDDRAYRRAAGEFLGDGDKLLDEAIRHGAPLTAVVTTVGVPVPPPGVCARVVTVPADVMESISPMRSPQGALFICRTPDFNPPNALTGQRYLILDGLQDPGNLGTIWRTADAFGADGLLLVNACDPFGHKAVRASMGACFRFPVWEAGADAAAALVHAAGLPLTATALTDTAADLRDCDLTRGAVVIGSEGRGVSPELLALCDGAVRIPMTARCESLNAAAAAAVILWEMGKQGGR